MFALSLMLCSLAPALALGDPSNQDYANLIEDQYGNEMANENAYANDAEDEEELNETVVRAGIGLRTSRKVFDYFTLYTDTHFFEPSTTYNHDLAIMSIGMALSASRLVPFESDAQLKPDKYLVQYLSDSGFEDIREDDYDRLPSLYTVATAIGHKSITDKDGNTSTLIVVGVCGGNYKKEWLSNVTVGLEGRHAGFDSAAREVTDRIFGYLGTNHVTGRVKIWIAGFSRAGAIANLTAANLDDSGFCSKDDLFAYTFATPRNTLGSPEGYDNIFNIVGPMDMVPQLAPAAWGFGRYGTDLVLPGQETDSDFARKYLKIQEGFETIYETSSNYNPKLNLSLRIIVGMFEQLTPTRNDYDSGAQGTVLSILEDKSVQNMLTCFRKLTVKTKDDPPEKRRLEDEMIETMGNFSGEVMNFSLLGNSSNEGSLGSLVFHEHIEDLYLMWMSMDLTPEELFGSPHTFTYLFVAGPADVSVTDTKTDEELLLANTDIPDMESLILGEGRSLAHFSFYNVQADRNVLCVAVPHDSNYEATWTATENAKIETYVIPSELSIHPSYETYVQTQDAKKGDSATFYQAKGSNVSSLDVEPQEVSSSQIATLVGLNHLVDGWRMGIMEAVLAACLIFIVIRLFGALLNHHGLNDRWKIRFVLSSIVMIGLVESEAAYWLFAATPMIRAFWKALAGVAVLLYCVDCRKPGSKYFWSVLLSLTLCTIGDIAINLWFLGGVIFFALAHLSFINLFQKIKPLRKVMWLWWLLASILVDFVIYTMSDSFDTAHRVGALCYAPILLLMLFTGLHQHSTLRLASTLFLTSDGLQGIYFLKETYAYLHMAYMLLYFLSLIVMCRWLCEEEIASPQEGDKDNE
ncbi:MAG: hypothetical protein IKG11_08590, partial [Atopobiaceae bacterium]|nr:hypothetical protein [Atopobiaceae bacterium]